MPHEKYRTHRNCYLNFECMLTTKPPANRHIIYYYAYAYSRVRNLLVDQIVKPARHRYFRTKSWPAPTRMQCCSPGKNARACSYL